MLNMHRTLAAAGALLVILLAGGPARAQAPAPSSTAPSHQAIDEWFQKKDKNKDGTIDREEFYQFAVESFYFRDKNKTGYVTLEQLQGASPEAVKAASRNGENRLTLDEYVNALFKDFAAADTNGDGKLTEEEIETYVRTNRR